jgi:hypothetical protein
MLDLPLMIGIVRAHALMTMHRFGRWLCRRAEKRLRAELAYWRART